MSKTALAALLRRVGKLDPALADQLTVEIKTITGGRELGLVFDRHIPETVELPGRKVRAFDKVRVRDSGDQTTWLVTEVRHDKTGQVADLTNTSDDTDTRTERVVDLVGAADFRDPIYPGLRSDGDRIERGGDNKPFHAVITAENYHALEALKFAYAGKVDCIYIDPPYNKLNKDWKYNNHFVDPDDPYAPSMWLAFMERRLKLAERLLNPANSVLIVTIDEKECQRLGLLLEQVFKAASIQMVSSVINPKGVSRGRGFRRTDEYLYFVMIGSATPARMSLGPEWSSSALGAGEPEESNSTGPEWTSMMRRGSEAARSDRPTMFYPIYADKAGKQIVHIGDPLPKDVHEAPPIKGLVPILPLRRNGKEGRWQIGAVELKTRMEQGRVRLGRRTSYGFVVNYLPDGAYADVLSDKFTNLGRAEDGSITAVRVDDDVSRVAPTQWKLASHNASEHGKALMSQFIPGRNFDFPKSLYAVEDTPRFFVGAKKDALIVDFFAGSGTTAHAVARLNRQDDGYRRCVLVTNNEVSATEAEKLREDGHRPGDSDWEKLGICECITKPRVRAAITGTTPEGLPVAGDYKFTDEFPMQNGFDENVEFFTLTYEDAEHVRVDMAFEAVAPLLWLRAGATGSRIDKHVNTFAVTDHYGILFDPDQWKPFVNALAELDDLRCAYVVTDEDSVFQAVARHLPDVDKVRLYESYLHNFEFVTGKR